jgi:hypothetical protein
MEDYQQLIKEHWGRAPAKLWTKNFHIGAKEEELTMFLIKTSIPPFNHYCGYVIFPEPPLKEEENYFGLASEVPVHGGITFARKYDDCFVYGFDCNHWQDERRIYTRDIDWLTEETERMAVGLLYIKEFESCYLLGTKQEKENLTARFEGALTHIYEQNQLPENVPEI